MNSQEIDLLNEVVEPRRLELGRILESLLSGRKLSIDHANALRDAIGEEIARTGVDPDFGAVNERGKQLDHLIDRVAQFSELHDRSP